MSYLQHVSERFHWVAQQRATDSALSYWHDQRWQHCSYARLVENAGNIAQRLARVGVSRGTAVGLIAHRHPDSIATMIAALDLGACFVPLDPQDPASRRQMLLASAKVALLVEPGEAVGEPRVSVLAEDTAAPPVEKPAPAAPRSAEDVAYVMFTSGSTGRAKGVLVPHRAISRLVFGQDWLRFDESRVFLHAAPMSFDASTFEIWGPLLNGGRCVLYPSGALPTADGLREVISATGVTTAWLTASLFHTIVDLDVQSLAGLEQLVVGGEALSVAHVGRALDELPNTELINGYGPTENTTFTTCHRIPRDMPRDVARIPIGRAINGTELLVVDEDLRPVPAGTEGELVAMGHGLALGYLDDPELTARKFVQVSCGDGAMRRGYRTGDRVVELADGVLDFLGRRDDQVKIHGYRIEPREVETVIGGLSAASQCRVRALVDPAGQTRLVAYVVLGAGADLDALKAQVVAALPTFMVPHQFVALPSFPLNANGKLATEALPEPWSVGAAPARGRRRGELDSVERAWAEVLGQAPASADVNFFDAGGRSLDAIRLQGLLEQRWRLVLEPTFVFEFTTVRRQAKALSVLLADATPVPTTGPDGGKGPRP